MNNSYIRIFAVPVALLVMAGALAMPSASADPANARQPVKGVFAYDRSAPAEMIYAKLQRTAEKLCAYPSWPSLIPKHDDACVASVMESGISRIGRTDIAVIHNRAQG